MKTHSIISVHYIVGPFTFCRITKVDSLYRLRAYPKSVSFYLIFLRNLMDICCVFSMPFHSSSILSTPTFSLLDSF